MSETSKAAHTPGPWVVLSDTDALYIAPKDGGRAIARIPPMAPNARQDAPLIAAAPDLLEVVEEICRTWDASNALHHVADPSYLHRKARDAIAKAVQQ